MSDDVSPKTAASLTAILAAACLCAAAADRASALYREARRAEKRGDFAGAYLKASHAVALAPAVAEYWNYSQALRTRALAALKPAPKPRTEADAAPALPAGWEITAEDLALLRELAPPPVLEGAGGRKSFRLQAPQGRSSSRWPALSASKPFLTANTRRARLFRSAWRMPTGGRLSSRWKPSPAPL